MKTLCETAESASQYVTGWLQRQPAVKEESITDWLLDYLDQHSSQIRYYQFTRHEEARSSGADWDWWIISRHGCFKLRVQAKKVKQHVDQYTDLARSNTSGYQIDMLLDSSASLNFYPIYSLYGFSEGVERCQRTSRPESLHICSAQEVYDLLFGGPRSRVEANSLLGLSIPLPCLFCCPLSRDRPQGGPGELFRNYFRTHPKPRGAEGDGKPDPDRGFEERTPEIIKRMFEVREINSNTEGILREYQSMFAGSKGVVIADLREQ
jgi:hypothetical protein